MKGESFDVGNNLHQITINVQREYDGSKKSFRVTPDVMSSVSVRVHMKQVVALCKPVIKRGEQTTEIYSLSKRQCV